PKGYIYFAMGFSIFVEVLNLRLRTRKAPRHPVELRPTFVKETEAGAAGVVASTPPQPGA
ncbi:MAG TPA: hypothetical protein VJQ79_15055, partial [Acidimicrobiia bacterium]|nr:hypothetical protein [Acidimicrobiia bacterium]